jgi:hypothetical protein
LFQTSIELMRRRSWMSLSGGASSYITMQDSGCSGLPRRDLSVSLWVRVDGSQHARSAFMGCFKTGVAGLDGWFVGTTLDGRFFAFVLRSVTANVGTMIADMGSQIQLGTWYVCMYYSKLHECADLCLGPRGNALVNVFKDSQLHLYVRQLHHYVRQLHE